MAKEKSSNSRSFLAPTCDIGEKKRMKKRTSRLKELERQVTIMSEGLRKIAENQYCLDELTYCKLAEETLQEAGYSINCKSTCGLSELIKL